MSAPARAAWLQVARKVMCWYPRGARKEQGVEWGGECKDTGTLGVGWQWEGGGVGGGRWRRCWARAARAGAADQLAQTLTSALAGSLQPPQRLGEGGRAGQSSGWKRLCWRTSGRLRLRTPWEP